MVWVLNLKKKNKIFRENKQANLRMFQKTSQNKPNISEYHGKQKHIWTSAFFGDIWISACLRRHRCKSGGNVTSGCLKIRFFTEINHAMGTQNHEKWRFYTPNIWVITPKNEGCGFPWWWGVPNWISERLWMFLSTRKEATPWRIHSCGAHSALHLLFDLFYLKMTNITPF